MKVEFKKKPVSVEMEVNVWYFVTRRDGFGANEVQSAYRAGFGVGNQHDTILYLEKNGVVTYSSFEYFQSEYTIIGEVENIVVS